MGKICPKCGKELRETARFCTSCGTKLEEGIPGNPVNTVNVQNGSINTVMPKQEKKWYQKTGWIIALLIVFFPVGLYLMWKYTDWRKNTKITLTSICAVGLVSCWIGGTHSDIADESEGIVIQNETAPYGAVYNYDFEEAKQKINTILSTYYNSDIDLDQFQVNEDSNTSENVTAYTFSGTVPQGYRLGIELWFTEGHLCGIVIKTELPLSIDDFDLIELEDIQAIYSLIVNSMTSDKLSIEEIKTVVKTGNTKADYFRNNNLYGICRTPDDSSRVFYYIVNACTTESADALGAQRL